LPGALADQVLAVSDFVARRKMDVDLVPGSRIQTIWNSLEMPPVVDDAPGTRSHAIRRELGIAPSRTLIACACRASPPKGLDHLFRAFDRLVSGDPSPSRPALVYAGDGPALDDLRSLRARLAACEDIHILGYRDDAADLLGAADFAVVPSTWAEAFGLAALEPMSRGRPVIASRTGGLPEIVLDGETGLLVEPGDETALMTAMRDLAQDPERRDRMGRSARRRALELFSRDRQLDRLEELVLRGFEPG
jgi:glycosyltransferase involved in cell wall biosynthesis